MLPISVCMIAKNEEIYIEECLKRLSAYDWEIIVVDTGSTDCTVQLANKYTPNIFYFDWINDFSAARNYAISKARNDYILVIDCDEYLETDANTNKTITNMITLITTAQAGMIHLYSPIHDSSETKNSSFSVIHDYIPRFFHKDYIHYQGTIHEQLASKNHTQLTFVQIPLTFYHAGYSTLEIKKKKTARNIPLLEAALKNNGSDSYLLFQLGQSYFGLTDYANALPYFVQALSLDVNEQEEYVQTLIESYGYCLLYLQQYSKALELEGIYSIFSKRADFVFLMGLIYMNNAMFEQAVEQFLKATSISNYSVEGVNSYKAYYNIGVIYECMGKSDEALQYYKECGTYSPAIERITVIAP